jgi:uncharacterized membrane protein
MPEDKSAWTDRQIELIIGNLLRAGVILAATVVFVGGVIYLWRHGREIADYRTFHEEGLELRSVSGIVKSACHLRGQGLIQLGLLLLIATPVARVVFTVFAFFMERDYTYVAVSLLVLGILLLGFFVGYG